MYTKSVAVLLAGFGSLRPRRRVVDLAVSARPIRREVSLGGGPPQQKFPVSRKNRIALRSASRSACPLYIARRRSASGNTDASRARARGRSFFAPARTPRIALTRRLAKKSVPSTDSRGRPRHDRTSVRYRRPAFELPRERRSHSRCLRPGTRGQPLWGTTVFIASRTRLRSWTPRQATCTHFVAVKCEARSGMRESRCVDHRRFPSAAPTAEALALPCARARPGSPLCCPVRGNLPAVVRGVARGAKRREQMFYGGDRRLQWPGVVAMLLLEPVVARAGGRRRTEWLRVRAPADLEQTVVLFADWMPFGGSCGLSITR